MELIKKAVSKYTVPKGNNCEINNFNIFKNSGENNELKNILNNLDNMIVKELIEFCRNNNIKGYSLYKKEELIIYIRDYFKKI